MIICDTIRVSQSVLEVYRVGGHLKGTRKNPERSIVFQNRDFGNKLFVLT